LVSDNFHGLLSKNGKSYCRQVDKVTVKGSIHPMTLFTVDMDLRSIRKEFNTSSKKVMKIKHLREKKEIVSHVYAPLEDEN
jgi:hypothetical protein